MTQTLKFSRSTKGTHLYEALESDPNPIVRNVYILKSALPEPKPNITISLTEDKPHEA